ncbi:MAG: SpoIIE family protein phosphatase [Phycisphaerales bacterium]
MSESTLIGSPYSLDVIAGPPLQPIAVSPTRPMTIGRLPECDVQLPEGERTVSRKHCRLEPRVGGEWLATDLESRHGTYINDVQLGALVPTPLRPGDVLRIGPWAMRFNAPGTRSANSTFTTDDTVGGGREAGQIEPVPRLRQSAIDRRRLELLIKAAKDIQRATTELALAECIVDALIEGTGYPRAAVIRPTAGGHERIDIVASKMASTSTASFHFSRSLVSAACSGQMVQLRKDDGPVAPMSILSVGTVMALAMPILLDSSAELCIYLDSRRDEPPVQEDAAAFCQAITEMCSLSLSSLKRAQAETDRQRLTEQLNAATEIQRQILPAVKGDFGGVLYAMDLRPGKFVAGDLFDIVRLDENRVAFFLGDVAGKGLPAAILAATTQSFLNAALRYCLDPADAATAVNAHLVPRCPGNKFVSLWLGVLNTETGILSYVDAGHGHWFIRPPGGKPQPVIVKEGTGAPLRVIEDMRYTSAQMKLEPGTRIVLYSDGVVEQRDPAEVEEFGLDRLVATVSPATDPDSEVQMIVQAVYRFAGTDALSDDLTVGSVLYVGPQAAPKTLG